MKKTLLVSIMLIPLMLIGVPICYAGNPLPLPPPFHEYGNCIGPDVTGTLTVEKTQIGSLNVTFKGTCKKFPVTATILDFGGQFEIITPQYLLGDCGECTSNETCTGPQELWAFIPPDCYPPDNKSVNPYPVVYKVIHYFENGNTKIFDIVGRWPVIIPIK